MIHSLTSWCAQNAFLGVIGTLFLILAGVVALRNVKLDAVPDLSDGQVTVVTTWPGRAPHVVDDQDLVGQIEDEVALVLGARQAQPDRLELKHQIIAKGAVKPA